ncbi:MAG: TIGR00268 family protein [Planctomycetota bacterium]|nr:MAG: TIGR00268 family protein [Planctomycetota bacterium]
MSEKISLNSILFEKETYLRSLIKELGRVVIGYSGGIDSTLMAKISNDELGQNALVVISDSPSLPKQELNDALKLAEDNVFNLRVIHTKEAEDENYLENSNNRCFYCKTELYQELKKIQKEEGYSAIIDGANYDDLDDYRPGRKAAKDKGVRSLLLESFFTKKNVRELAEKLGLSNYDKPAAACLSSRFPYGTSITVEKLSQVEQAEVIIKKYVNGNVRVRFHNEVARVEVDSEEFVTILENKNKIYSSLQEIGFKYIALDIMGFRSGSLNE